MSTLQLNRLTKTYEDGSRVVADLDLQIDDGELFVLVGPSGCGKTTVLRMIAGLEAVTRGEVLIDGVRVNDLATRQRDIAMAFQSYALYPNMTVAENIGFALRVANVPKATLARRVREVAQLLRLSDVLDRWPGQLSGGQRQRTALGRAIIREPRLLLMDEPMSDLDANLRTETRAALCRLQRRLGVTTMCVTHDQVEAMAMGDRIAVMHRGRIVQCGTPLELYHAPDNVFVAQFFGAPSMSVVQATVVGASDGLEMSIGSQSVPLDDAALARLPMLRQMVGRRVALGARPEAFHEDATGSLVASVAFVERLGSEQLAHVTIDAPRVTHDGDRLFTDARSRSTIIVSLDASLELSIWRPLTLRIDTTQIHLFDLSTGDAIRRARA